MSESRTIMGSRTICFIIFTTFHVILGKEINCLLRNSLIQGGICIRCISPLKNFDNLICPSLPLDNGGNPSNCVEEEFVSCPASSDDIDTVKIDLAAKFLNGRHLKAVTIERRPFVRIVGKNFSGVCFELFYTLQEKYNFSSEVFIPPDGSFGAELPNGSYSGMVGLVYTKNADVGVAGFSVTFERYRVVAFTESFHQEPTAILIPPPSEGEKLSVLIRPLSSQVWFGVALSMFTVAPTMYLMHVCSLRIRGVETDLRFFDLMGQLFHFMIGALVQESVVSPVNKTSRFLIILWWMTAIIISNIYVAYLVSYLSSPRLFNAVNSLDDLVKQRHIKWTFRESSALESLFKSGNSIGVYKAVGDRVPQNELAQSDNEGAQKAFSGKYAFIKEKSFLDVALAENFLQTHQCKATLAKQTFFKVETALITQKMSKLLDVFNHGISWTVSSGLMEKWKSVHWPREIWCADAAAYISSTQPKTRKLSIEEVQGAYLLWGSGLIFAIISFVVEKLSNASRNYLHGTHPPETNIKLK